MVHIHKEICLFSETGKAYRWHHLDAIHVTTPSDEEVIALLRDCRKDPIWISVNEWSVPSEITAIDYRFFGETIRERLHVSNKALVWFQLKWNERFGGTFNKVFGSWPWDHLSAFSDPDHYVELRKEYGIKDCRAFIWVS